MIEAKSHESSAKFQYLSASVVNLLSTAFGISEGWTSPAVFLLTSDKSPLPCGKISMDEASWIASLLCIGCLFGNIFFGYVTNKYGRKWPLTAVTIPAIISWLLVIFGSSVYQLYAARLISGFAGGGVYILVPLYLSEIANDRVRGALVSTLNLTENFGLLLGYIIGGYFSYYTTPKFAIGLVFLVGVLLFFFPESPTFLVKQNKFGEAKNSIRFYQNLSKNIQDDTLVEMEMNKLKRTINDDQPEKSIENTFQWSDLMTNKVQKAMTIGFVIVALNQFSGCVAMLNYTDTIFEEAGSNMSPTNSTIIVGAIQVVGVIFVTNLVDRVGRKSLFAVSTFGTTIGLLTLGIYMMLKTQGYSVEAYNWIPLLSFSFVIFAAALGILSLHMIVLSEVMPEKVKDFGVSTCMVLLWLFSFTTIKYLPFLTDTLGLDGSMFLFAVVCIACAIFIMFCVPETKGKSQLEIMKSLE